MVRAVPLPTITDDSTLGGAVIEKSLRFNDDDSKTMSRTFGTNTSDTTKTLSFWMKRGNISSYQIPFGTTVSGYIEGYIRINNDDTLQLEDRNASDGTSDCRRITSEKLRDPSAWYHIVLALDSTQGTEADRAKFYINGTQATISSSISIAQNYSFQFFRSSAVNFIGVNGNSSNYFDGYLAEVNFIDGQALGPEYFGFTEFQTGAWKPRGYDGTYGNNGFRLDFLDKTNNQTLGLDKSGRGNHFATNNFSTSSGKDGDSFIDTPTNNFPTLNPLVRSGTSQSLSDGNLTRSGGAFKCMATFEALNGKYYFEYKAEDGNGNHAIGVCQITTDQRSRINTEAAACFAGNGEFKIENNSQTSGFATWGNGDIISVAIDTTLTTPKVWFAVNNSWQAASGNSGTFNPSGGYSLTSGKKYTFTVDHGSGSSSTTGTCFFGAHQGGFNYDPPSGFKALSSKNLPKPTTPIINPDQHFDTLLYTGTGSSNIVEGLKFQPDMVWVKGRDTNGYENMIIDSVRGGTKSLVTNSDDAESTHGGRSMTFYNRGVRWNSDSGNCNANGENYVLWCWKGGGASVSNGDGSVTTTISANPKAGFSIVDYNGGGNGSTMGHGLGAVPHWIIIKKRDSDSPGGARGWAVFHRSLPTDKPLRLNSTTQQLSEANFFREDLMSTTVFGVNGDYDTGYSGDDYIAYVWTEIPGFSRFGSYVGNGNADGPFVHCGFRPAFVLTKMYDGINENWTISDSTRSTYNPVDLFLRPDESTKDTSGAATMDFCAQGFKLRNTDSKTNRDGGKFIFAAFAEQSPVTPYDEFTNAR